MTDYQSLLVNGATGWHAGNQTLTYSFLGSSLPSYYGSNANHYYLSSLDSGLTLPRSSSSFALTSAEQALAMLALQAWNDVAYVNLAPASSGHGDITFGAGNFSSTGLYGFVSNFAGNPGSASEHGDVWLNHNNSYQAAASWGNDGWQTFIHELGHALGLHHPDEDPNNFDGSPTNNNQYTVMSYVPHPDAGSGDVAWPVTPMLYDVEAIQQLYGANLDTRTGDTTYFGDTGVYALDDGGDLAGTSYTGIVTIWDAGGIDTIDASNQSSSVIIDLNPGAFSTIGPVDDNIALAYAVTDNGEVVNYIENAIGGSGNDRITGNDAGNILEGGAGRDRIDGGAGNDVVFWDANDNLSHVLGGDDHDILVFTSGDAPTSFNLASHEFEAAEGRFTDTLDQEAWAGYTDFYTIDWLRDVQTGTNDSGSTWLTDFDQNSEYDWSEVTLYYDTFGDTDVYVGHRDDGSGWVVDYDLEDTQGWFSAGYYYDHLGRDDSSLGTYDDGRSWLIDYDQDDTQGWSLTRNIFTESGATDLFAGDYDDGRSWLIDYDQDSVEGWSYVQIFFDTAGATDIYTGLWDDGRYWHYDMDQNDEQAWAEDNYLYDPSGNLLSHWQIMDDGSTVYV